MKALLISALVLCNIALGQSPRNTPARMSVAQAEQFALAAIPVKLKRLPAFQLETSSNADESLYIFNALWAGLPGGSVEVGFYAVDPVTGTVWNAVMECDRLTSPRLRELQMKWTKQSGLTKAQLLKLQATGPQCSAK
jgi:hypothetical protein